MRTLLLGSLLIFSHFLLAQSHKNSLFVHGHFRYSKRSEGTEGARLSGMNTQNQYTSLLIRQIYANLGVSYIVFNDLSLGIDFGLDYFKMNTYSDFNGRERRTYHIYRIFSIAPNIGYVANYNERFSMITFLSVRRNLYMSKWGVENDVNKMRSTDICLTSSLLYKVKKNLYLDMKPLELSISNKSDIFLNMFFVKDSPNKVRLRFYPIHVGFRYELIKKK